MSISNLIKNKQFILIVELIFFILIYFTSIIPLRDFDIWFHIKSGEIISSQGIIHHDVFSYNTAGRVWYPYEWLFQVSVYTIQQIAGFEAIKYWISFFVVAQIYIVFKMARKLLDLPPLTSLFLAFLFYASIFEFFTARPQVYAYTFLLANLFFILLYYLKNKNYLWATIPITIFWANMHGSIFLGIYFFVTYSILALLNSLQLSVLGFRLSDSSHPSHQSVSIKTAKLNTDQLDTDNSQQKTNNRKAWLKKFKTLSIFTLANIICTILPPLGFTQYKLLLYFYQHRQLINNFIDEWSPLILNPIPFIIFTITVIMIAGLFFYSVVKNRSAKSVIWLLPLIPIIPTSYIATRNLFLAYIPLILMLGYVIKQIKWEEKSKQVKFILLFLGLILIGVNIWVISQKKIQEKAYFPVKASEFMKQYKLNGRMFNEYAYGGYLLYHLYPEYKVFFDGRTDLYLEREMPDTLEIAVKKGLPNDKYSKLLYNQLWNKYNISYVILRTEKHVNIRKIANILVADPNWSLIYWDDYTQIIVRKDGKNKQILEEFGTSAATPYDRNPYRTGMEAQALNEYERMQKVSDSSKSRNAIGYLLLKQGKIDQAKKMFEAATTIDPSDESPYMNLAEIYAKDKDYDRAISYYIHAQKLAIDRGLIYIRLGQLYIEGHQNLDKAREVWELGVKNTVDTSARKRLIELLSK